MPAQLELSRAIGIGRPVYAVAISRDAQYAACGSDQGLAVYDRVGNRRLAYPGPTYSLPVVMLAMAPDLEFLVLGTREGAVELLEISRQGGEFEAGVNTLCDTPSDLNCLALCAEKRLLAIGHLGPALTMLSADGRVLWRRHPESGTATRTETWSVAFDASGSTLYAGSAGPASNVIAAWSVSTGVPGSWQPVESRVVHIAPLAASAGVAAVLTSGIYEHSVVVYAADLSAVLWSCEFYEPVTALAADPQLDLLAMAVGYEGEVRLLQGTTGHVLAAGYMLHSVVNALAITQGSFMAAGTEDGQVLWLHSESGELSL